MKRKCSTCNKTFIVEILKSCRLWEVGTITAFRYQDWELIFKKEDLIYKPFTFTISGKKRNSNETINRRYTSAEMAFLHMLNDFNENINVKNKYQSLEDALQGMG